MEEFVIEEPGVDLRMYQDLKTIQELDMKSSS